MHRSGRSAVRRRNASGPAAVSAFIIQHCDAPVHPCSGIQTIKHFSKKRFLHMPTAYDIPTAYAALGAPRTNPFRLPPAAKRSKTTFYVPAQRPLDKRYALCYNTVHSLEGRDGNQAPTRRFPPKADRLQKKNRKSSSEDRVSQYTVETNRLRSDKMSGAPGYCNR